jgi:hypothetical protein
VVSKVTFGGCHVFGGIALVVEIILKNNIIDKSFFSNANNSLN